MAQVERVDPSSAEALALVREFTAEVGGLYGNPAAAAEMPANLAAFVIARLGDAAVGCGALVAFGPGVGELKRIYVRPDARGRGIGRRIVARLEEIAREAGHERLVLETGLKQAAAIRLYEAMGYARMPAITAHAGDGMSVGFEKWLGR